MEKEEKEASLSKVIEVDIENEMKKSFLEYSMSVIVSRALPDVRDGLKPVHRRILYTMLEDGLMPDKAYRKCATTVGSVLGRYHPHGDASVYDALVRLAQDFSMRYMLVDGHGNFGSVDGDPPAAYRYTESRMSKVAVEMLTDINKDTVNFVLNYDGHLKEPTVLPSRLPNLLVNGSTGIAVGMATNIPPHNMKEVIDAVCLLIDNPNAELPEIMQYIKGPDFPTRAIIMGRSGIRSAYATGRGKITVRARAQIEEENNGRFKIIVTELPYQVNKARLIENIADMVKEKRLDGISNIDDHSDRDGMRIEITVRRDASPQVVLNKLYSFSQMQITFGVIMLAIVNGEPKILTLKDCLVKYLDFQKEIIIRRVKFDLKKAEEKSHILEGLKIAIDFIDEVIKILRSSQSIVEGKSNLCERFGLDDVQAQAIVQMPLGRLTGLERGKIEQEIEALHAKISYYKEILSDNVKILGIVKEELLEIKKRFGDDRRTEIVDVSGEVDIEDLIPEEECVLTMTNRGYIKRQSTESYKTQKRGGRGISGMSRREEDIAKEMFVINTHDYVLFFTNKGRAYKLKCFEIPEGSRVAKGMNISNLLAVSQDEKVTSMIRVPKFDKNKYLVMVTSKGLIKRIGLDVFENIRKGGLTALDLNENDELKWVKVTDGDKEIMVATKKGKIIRFKEDQVRVTGRTAKGVRALRLRHDDEVAGVLIVCEESKVLTVSETGYGRLSSFSQYKLQSRGGMGSINYHTEKYGDVAAIDTVDTDEDIIIISTDGIIIRIAVDSIRICSRTSKGVKVMKLPGNSKVVAIARVAHDSEEESNDENENNVSEDSVSLEETQGTERE